MPVMMLRVVGACAGQHGLCYSQRHRVIAFATVSTLCHMVKAGLTTSIDQLSKTFFVESRFTIM